MPRTVDPARHHAQRLRIIDATLTCVASHGYHGATTARICREAGISSGTFFHYFPTKLDVLTALLDYGTQEVTEWFEHQAGRTDPLEVVLDFADRAGADATDPRTPAFVAAMGALLGEPEIFAALRRDEEAQIAGLVPWLAAAQNANQIRADLDPPALAQWVFALLDGVLARLAAGGLQPTDAQAHLRESVARLLTPAGQR